MTTRTTPTPSAPTPLAETDDDQLRSAVLLACSRAQQASRLLRPLTRATKDSVLLAMAQALDAAAEEVAAANTRDVEAATQAGLRESLVDRLRLDAARLQASSQGLRELVALPDPVGEVVRGQRLPNGLEVRQTRVPMGVVAMVYEARPNVTIDAAGLALKSGNAVVLRGGSAATHTNRALVRVLRATLVERGLPADAVVLLDEGGRDAVRHLMTARGYVDVLIPRGGADLIRAVVEGSTVPVIETGVGNCHVYVDASADVDKALLIAVNSKVHRPGVCNAAETLLVHRGVAQEFLARALPALHSHGVRLHVDDAVAAEARQVAVPVSKVSEADWGDEYLSLDLAVGVVDDMEGALEHIGRWSTGHTEAIVTESQSAARTFVARVDAAAIMVNASTRFTDGAQLGLGAEIGISTQKLHARGPMGLAELTTTTWVVTGEGHVRG